jgi:hypothetical protein
MSLNNGWRTSPSADFARYSIFAGSECSTQTRDPSRPNETLHVTLHTMALKNSLTARTELCAVLLQALLNRRIVPQLLSAKARSIARTRFLFLRRAGMPALC